MGLGINLVSVSMNYTAPAEAIYNIVLSKPPSAQHHPCYLSNVHDLHTFWFMMSSVLMRIPHYHGHCVSIKLTRNLAKLQYKAQATIGCSFCSELRTNSIRQLSSCILVFWIFWILRLMHLVHALVFKLLMSAANRLTLSSRLNSLF